MEYDFAEFVTSNQNKEDKMCYKDYAKEIEL
jgi:hypothetical protein